jgi:flavin-dependent dehydrogenase
LLSREALDSALIAAAVGCGAHFLPGASATLGEAVPEARRVSIRYGSQSASIAARVVLAADGLGGKFLGAAGVGNPPRPGARVGIGAAFANTSGQYPPGTIYMACAGHGYLGVERLEDGRIDVAGAFDVSAIRRANGPGAAAARALAEVGWPVPDGLARAAWRGTPPLTRQADRLGMERVFAIGDAASYVEPFTGEGMAWALASAVAVTPLAGAAITRWEAALVGRWADAYRRLVGRRWLICRAAASILRRPRLTRLTLDLLRLAPDLARPIVALLNAPAAVAFRTL